MSCDSKEVHGGILSVNKFCDLFDKYMHKMAMKERAKEKEWQIHKDELRKKGVVKTGSRFWPR